MHFFWVIDKVSGTMIKLSPTQTQDQFSFYGSGLPSIRCHQAVDRHYVVGPDSQVPRLVTDLQFHLQFIKGQPIALIVISLHV